MKEDELKQLRKSLIVERSLLQDKRDLKDRILTVSKGKQLLYQQYINEKIKLENEMKLKAFKEEIKFKSDGEKRINKFGKEVMHFIIEVAEKEKFMEIGTTQYDFLRTIGQKKKDNKGTLIGVIGVIERVGSTQKDTRRTIQFK